MDMPKECPACGLPYLPEPGFYLGAAYISYAINAILFAAVALALVYSRVGITWGLSLIATAVIVFGLLPLTLRISKSVWIHMLVKYRGKENRRTYI